MGAPKRKSSLKGKIDNFSCNELQKENVNNLLQSNSTNKQQTNSSLPSLSQKKKALVEVSNTSNVEKFAQLSSLKCPLEEYRLIKEQKTENLTNISEVAFNLHEAGQSCCEVLNLSEFNHHEETQFERCYEDGSSIKPLKSNSLKEIFEQEHDFVVPQITSSYLLNLGQ